MTVRLLGTAAAEGIPAFYCGCRVCENARAKGGKEVRTRSGALIDGHLKIDLPPDTLGHLHRDNLDTRDWSALVFTHSHDDHFAREEIQYGLYPFNDRESLGFTIFGNEALCSAIEVRYPEWPMDIERTQSFIPFCWGEYTITPISARHVEDEDAQNLIVEDGSKALLYATDTGVWLSPTWEFLEGVRLDALVMECTSGVSDDDYKGHHNLASFLQTLGRLREMGVLSSGAPVYTTHHSHNGGLTFAEAAAHLEPHGVAAGFDGLEFEI